MGQSQKYMSKNKIWMGVGLYDFYLNNINNFVCQINNFDKVKIILADEIQKYNITLDNQKDKEAIKVLMIKKLSKIEMLRDNIDFNTWSYLNNNTRYNQILNNVIGLYNQDKNFQSRAEKLTSVKIKSDYKDKNISTLVGYTLEEIASIYYFAEKGYIKAGHEGEKVYDNLAKELLTKNSDKLKIKIDKLDFYYLKK